MEQFHERHLMLRRLREHEVLQLRLHVKGQLAPLAPPVIRLPLHALQLVLRRRAAAGRPILQQLLEQDVVEVVVVVHLADGRVGRRRLRRGRPREAEDLRASRRVAPLRARVGAARQLREHVLHLLQHALLHRLERVRLRRRAAARLRGARLHLRLHARPRLAVERTDRLPPLLHAATTRRPPHGGVGGAAALLEQGELQLA
mmetsp:Transcript_2976/g.6306  ORF Transcript_2976/g.6306 Transcript_2976/m.6306 type:complete len:202 (-) Transcript_2976:305-910(-)